MLACLYCTPYSKTYILLITAPPRKENDRNVCGGFLYRASLYVLQFSPLGYPRPRSTAELKRERDSFKRAPRGDR